MLSRNLGKHYPVGVQLFWVNLSLGITLAVSSIPGVTAELSPNLHNSFADWCKNRSNLEAATQHTVDVLLQKAGTTECDRASTILQQTANLDLGNQQLSDLRPLASLTHLTSLNLSFNQIRDISPLSSLTGLTFLLLTDNQISDIRPLATLANLTYLILDKNQIAETVPLPQITKLIVFDLQGNPLRQKTCPVFPETTCIFSNDGQDLYAQAQQQYERGEFVAALESLNNVLAVYQETGDRIKAGDVLNRIGDTYTNLSQYPQALKAYQEVFSIRQNLGDLPGIGQSLTSLALTYERLGQYQKALSTLEQALDNIKQQMQGNIPLEGGIYELPKDEAALHNSLALVQTKLGKHEAALASAQQSLKLYRLLPDEYSGKRYGERAALDTIGITYSNLGQTQKALEILAEAKAIAREIQDRAGEASTLNHLGEVYATLGEREQALTLFNQALAIRQAVGDRAGVGATLNDLGATLLAMGKSDRASEILLSAIKIWESLRPGLTDDNQVSLFETQVETYSNLQKALVAQNQAETALEIAERGRARAFVELLASRLGTQVGEQFQRQQPLTIEQIRQIAKQQNATLVEYSIVQKTLYIWVIQPNGTINLRTVDLKDLENTIEDSAERSRVAAWTGRIRGSEPAIAQVVQTTRSALTFQEPEIVADLPTENLRLQNPRLQQAYQLLIQPIADLLPADPNSPVVFIPQGHLFLVPFNALQDPEGTYLIEKHTLLTAPSIQVLALTQQQQAQLSATLHSNQAVVVGNPTMPRIGEPPKPLSSLPGAEREATAIAQILGAEALIGDRATKARAVEQMASARFIHLATHGLLDDFGDGVPGAIALAPTPTDSGLLATGEILNLKLQAELVVLSACDTGRGKITGDGVIGLSRAFIAAGVPSIVVSLWQVSDESTALLMQEFYKNIQHNPNKAQALRKAILSTLQAYPEPRDWAAFTLMGNMQ